MKHHPISVAPTQVCFHIILVLQTCSLFRRLRLSVNLRIKCLIFFSVNVRLHKLGKQEHKYYQERKSGCFYPMQTDQVIKFSNAVVLDLYTRSYYTYRSSPKAAEKLCKHSSVGQGNTLQNIKTIESHYAWTFKKIHKARKYISHLNFWILLKDSISWILHSCSWIRKQVIL